MPYKSKIANLLLHTPFDSKASVSSEVSSQLSVYEFLHECYVEPHFNTSTLSEEETINQFELFEDIDKAVSELKNQYAEEKKFFDWIGNIDDNKVYTISGNAGTGKTTYINNQKYRRTENWIIINIDKTTDWIELFGDYTIIVNGFSDIGRSKIYSGILKKIRNIFFNFYTVDKNYDIDKIKENLNMIVAVYNNNFKDKHPSGETFVKELEKISQIRESDCLAEELAKYLLDFFQKLQGQHPDSYTWRKALDILLLLLHCVHLQKTINIIIFDNLEKFVGSDELYNEEIDLIRRELNSYSEDIGTPTHCHYGKFKFVMAMRNNSERMCGTKLHSSDDLPSNFDMNNWFSIDDVIEKKEKWYSKRNIENADIQLAKQIISDIRKSKRNELTGMRLEIALLFNYNKRLIIDFIGQTIESVDNKKFISDYKRLWKQDSIGRYAARSIIRGLILKGLDANDNLFEKLKLYSTVENGLSETRQILSLLYNTHNKEMALSDILANIFCTNSIYEDWKTIDEIFKKRIAEILYYMNSYNRRDNDWIQFIDLQIEGSKNNVAVEDTSELQDLIDNRMKDFKLKLMPAGEAYLKYIVASFEYFSFRYYKDKMSEYKPLFSTIPTKEEIANCKDLNKLECFVIMNYVKERAKKCINMLKNKPDISLKSAKDGKYKKHHIRIIGQHQGYIDRFIEYINKYMGSDGSRVVSKCKSIINEYNTFK